MKPAFYLYWCSFAEAVEDDFHSLGTGLSLFITDAYEVFLLPLLMSFFRVLHMHSKVAIQPNALAISEGDHSLD